MSNREYRIDGRDPNAKGYVKENRMANQQETDALVKVLEGWGLVVDGFKFHLYGRLDDVHGWYLFGISRDDSNREDFVVLGDCLDAMEAPYDKVLDLDDVIHFANTTGTHENIGTAYDAMEKWGVFESPSEGLYEALEEVGATVENERAHWDDKRKEWKLSYDVMFDTDMGGNEKVTITIPAQLGTQEEADREFMEQCEKHCPTIIRKKQVEAKVSVDEQGYVWVLTIYKDEQFFPEVHRTFDGAVDGAVNDIAEHMEEDEVDDYDYKKIRKELESQHYWHDDIKDVVYDIADCPLCK